MFKFTLTRTRCASVVVIGLLVGFGISLALKKYKSIKSIDSAFHEYVVNENVVEEKDDDSSEDSTDE